MLVHASVHANKDLLNSCISAHIVIQEQAFWISLTVKLDMTHRACNRLDNNTLINGHTYRHVVHWLCWVILDTLVFYRYLQSGMSGRRSAWSLNTSRSYGATSLLIWSCVSGHLMNIRSIFTLLLALCQPLSEISDSWAAKSSTLFSS